MQKKDFLYFLTDKAGRCYKVDGEVVLNNEYRPLAYTPDGWQDKMIQYARNQTYFGTVRSFTVPLGFVEDGAEIIRFLFYSRGVNAECYLRIARLNRLTGEHERYFVGALDFSTFSDEREFVKINILDSGLASIIKSKEGTTYEIPLAADADDPLPVTDPTVRVLLDGITLKGNRKYSVTNGISSTDTHFLNGSHIVNLDTLTTEGDDFQFRDVKRTRLTSFSDNALTQTGEYFFKTSKSDTVSFEYDFQIHVTQLSTVVVDLLMQVFIRWIKDGVTIDAHAIYEVSGTPNIVGSQPTQGKTHHIQGSVDLGIPEGCEVYLVAGVTAFGSAGDDALEFDYIVGDDTNFFFKASALLRHPPTFCKALTPAFVFKRLVHKLSGETDNTKSDLLDQTKAYTVFMTTGDAIRRLDSSMKITFQDFFKAMNVMFNAGLGIENEVARLEEKAYFFTEDELIYLDDISNLKVSPAADLIYNDIKIGYEKQTYDDVNGKDEFNNTSEFSTPITRIKNELDLVSPFRADMYGIEFTRIKTEGKDTTDTSSDDTIFLLVCESSPYTDDDGEYYKLYRGLIINGIGPDISGLISPETAFNIEISPKHLLYRHGDYIHGMLDKLDSESLVFQTADKNDALSIANQIVTTGRGVITENTDVRISDLDPKLYLPYYFEFDTNIPNGAKEIFDNNPRGQVRFTWKGNDFKGFIMECGIKPAFEESQFWKLLAAPDVKTELLNG